MIQIIMDKDIEKKIIDELNKPPKPPRPDSFAEEDKEYEQKVFDKFPGDAKEDIMFEMLVSTKAQYSYSELIEMLKIMKEDDPSLNLNEIMDDLMNLKGKAELVSDKYIISLSKYFPL